MSTKFIVHLGGRTLAQYEIEIASILPSLSLGYANVTLWYGIVEFNVPNVTLWQWLVWWVVVSHGSQVTRQLTDGLSGSWVIESDTLSALVHVTIRLNVIAVYVTLFRSIFLRLCRVHSC